MTTISVDVDVKELVEARASSAYIKGYLSTAPADVKARIDEVCNFLAKTHNSFTYEQS